MSDSRYKTLLANLPAVAAVVNSFESPEVQVEAYHTLMSALDDHTGSRRGPKANGAAEGNGRTGANGRTDGDAEAEPEVVHDIVDGGNIHADDAD